MPETTHPPSGQYPKPENAHHIDLVTAADELLAKLPGHSRQTRSLARESGVSTILMAMEGGDALEEHSAAGVVTVQLMSGLINLSAGGTSFELRPGQMVMIQAGVRHDVEAVAQSVILLTVTGGHD